MSAIEWILIVYASVMAYIAGAGITTRLIGFTLDRSKCGECGGIGLRSRCVRCHDDLLFLVCGVVFWPISFVIWIVFLSGKYILYKPSVSLFRITAGVNREKEQKD